MTERERPITVDHPRCPFCHDAVLPDSQKEACNACMAWHHAECWSEHGKCSACGAEAEGDRGPKPDPALEQIARLYRGEKKIQAIKLYRERTGDDLKTAKEAVEALAAGRAPASGKPTTTPLTGKELDPEVEAALIAGRSIAAIKRYRDLHGCDLKTAREQVDLLCAELGLQPVSAAQDPAKVALAAAIAALIAIVVAFLALNTG